MVNKDVCDRGYIWNPSNCECECDKSCDVGEYLYSKNCKCRKRLVDNLVEERTENIEETSLIKLVRQSANIFLAHYTLCYFQQSL